MEETNTEKYRRIEECNKSMEGMMKRMMETMAGSSGEVPPVIRHQRPEQNLPVGRREETPPVNHFRHIKLDCPRFDGGDPTEWLSKIKQYFAFHEVPMEQRVGFASYHLTAEANAWWQATSKALRLHPHTTDWETFEHELWIRFGPSEGENFHEALSKIQQTGSLRDYQKEFERLMNKVENWSEDALVGTFLGGLKDAIADNVRMFSPTTLRMVIKLARLRDEQLQKQRRPFTPRPQSQTSTTHQPPPSTSTPKKLSWDEMKRKRSLGLCFSCDERYTPGHKCKTSQLLLMLGADVEEEEEDEIFHDTNEPEITLQSLTGWDSPKTLRVEATINRQQLVALIDSSATHNFISDKAANRLNLKLTPTKPFSVRVADGHPLRCRGTYRHTTMSLGSVAFSIDFYALPLSGLDVVLGVQWLASLGPTLCNWKAQSMEFMWADKLIKLQGLQQQKISKAHSEEKTKEAKMGQACFALTIHEERTGTPTIDPEMSHILQQFTDVFQTPSSLPPPTRHRASYRNQGRFESGQRSPVPLCPLSKR